MSLISKAERIEFFRQHFNALIDGRPLPRDPLEELRNPVEEHCDPAVMLQRLQQSPGRRPSADEVDRALNGPKRLTPTPPAAPRPPADSFLIEARFAHALFIKALWPPGGRLCKEVFALLPAGSAPANLSEKAGLSAEQLYPDADRGPSFILGETKVVAAPVSRVMAGNGRRYATDVYGGAEYQYVPKDGYTFSEIAGWTLRFHKARAEAEAKRQEAEQDRRQKATADQAEQLRTTAERLRLLADAVLERK